MGATLYRDAALADGTSASLQLHVSVLVRDDRIVWIRPSDAEEACGDAAVVDCSGASIVPGMVDCHSHLTMPGGAHWIQRGGDPPAVLMGVAEDNGALQVSSGVRWARDVGAPRGVDPVDGRLRALSLGVRDRWRGRRDRPYVRAAGTWVTRRGTLHGGYEIEVDDGDGLLAAALQQLDEGADLVKLYMDGPDRETSPFTASEVGRVVDACHARGAKVTAHATVLAGARECAQTQIDSIEHGMQLDADICRLLAEHGTAVVSTLTVLRSWRSFATTTDIARFASSEGRAAIAAREEGRWPRSRWHTAAACASARAPTSAAARRAPTTWRGRWRRWCRRGCSPGKRLQRPPGTAASCSANPTQVASATAAPPTSSSSTATR